MIGFFIFIRFLLSTVPNEFYYSGNIIEAFVKPIENQISNNNIKVDKKKYNVCMLLQYINNASESNYNILNTIFPHDNDKNFQKKFMLTFVSHSDEKNLKCSLNELESFLAQCKRKNLFEQKHEITNTVLNFADISSIYEYPEDLKLGLLHTEDIQFDNFDYIDFLNNLDLLNNNEEIFKGLLCIILPFDSIFIKKYIDYLKFALNDLIDKPYFKLVTWTNLNSLNISEHRQSNFELFNRKVYEEHLMNLNNIYYEVNSLYFNLKIKYIFPERELIINYFKSKNINIWRIFQLSLIIFTPRVLYLL